LAKPAYNLAWIGIIAAIYASLTVSLGTLGYSWIQVRLSEALAPLPFLMGFPAIGGITLGCAIANSFSPVGIPDLVLGPLLSMFSAFLSWKFSYKRKMLACLYPVLINAFGVSGYVSVFYNVPYVVSVLTIGMGEFVACFLLGYPLLVALERIHFWDYFNKR
jgi:uncharacterized membrane protein